MKRTFAALSVLSALGACAAPGTGVYRDPAAPISASTRFDPAAVSGSWQVVETFGPMRSGEVSFETGGETISVSGTGRGGIDGTYRQGVPGELIPTTAGRDTLVVFWMDESRETAALGTVSGSYGALIDRDGRIPPDKTLAARAIFDFYGWDIAQLNRSGS
jgi:apolipoprotein D and lipocalin family protein